jgi:hypothetical protein
MNEPVLDNVPPELILYIFHFVPLVDLATKVSLVCHDWQDMIMDLEFWRMQCDKIIDSRNVDMYIKSMGLTLKIDDQLTLTKYLCLDLLRTVLPTRLITTCAFRRPNALHDFVICLPKRLNEYVYQVHENSTHVDTNVLSDEPIPTSLRKVPFYYVEMTLMEGSSSTSTDATVTLGFAHKNYAANKQPGWNTGSVAYHGDDGGIFVGPTGRHTYSREVYHIGDTVGVGLHIPSNRVFFTKNAQLQMVACSINENEPLHICVGMWDKIHISMNFGKEKPFVFDLSTIANHEGFSEFTKVKQIQEHFDITRYANVTRDEHVRYILDQLREIQTRILHPQNITDDELREMLTFVNTARENLD